MKKFKNLLWGALALCVLSLSSCLHIIEEVTFKNNGSGQYKMTIDMSELKGMMDMMKGMSQGADSTAIQDAPEGLPDNSMSQMGEQLSSVANSIKSVEGISNVVEVNDTTNLQFGYTFSFANVAALNRALKIINKDKYETKVDEIYKFEGKSFERLPTGDIGAEMKKALAENGGEEVDESMDMMKMMFADMSYKQIYHFPDRTIKKNSNALGELSDGDHTLTITLKPFNEDQQKQNPTVAAKLKLK
jgi:hypothetical protein